MNSEPQCLWSTGVITKENTALPETEYMKAEDLSLNSTEEQTRSILTARPQQLGPVHMQDGACGHRTM
eukprot:2797475-Heterocapsa_arctica.AAC.1